MPPRATAHASLPLPLPNGGGEAPPTDSWSDGPVLVADPSHGLQEQRRYGQAWPGVAWYGQLWSRHGGLGRGLAQGMGQSPGRNLLRTLHRHHSVGQEGLEVISEVGGKLGVKEGG